MGNYGKVKNRWLKVILKWPGIAIISHWVFQGLLYMDVTERWFKIGVDVLLSILFYCLLNFMFRPQFSVFIALILAHTVNFFFNGQLWGILKHYDLVQLTRTSYNNYIQQLVSRAGAESSIKRLVAYGSIVREKWTPNSDFDARIIRKPGFYNGLRASFFLMAERTRALLSGFPIDLYLLDTDAMLDKQSLDETGIELIRNL